MVEIFVTCLCDGFEFCFPLFSTTDYCLCYWMSKKNGGKPPLSYQSFLKLAGEPSWASSPLSITLSSLPPVGNTGNCNISEVPTVEELGYEETQQVWRNVFCIVPCC